jgi:hypothetical protein
MIQVHKLVCENRRSICFAGVLQAWQITLFLPQSTLSLFIEWAILSITWRWRNKEEFRKYYSPSGIFREKNWLKTASKKCRCFGENKCFRSLMGNPFASGWLKYPNWGRKVYKTKFARKLIHLRLIRVTAVSLSNFGFFHHTYVTCNYGQNSWYKIAQRNVNLLFFCYGVLHFIRNCAGSLTDRLVFRT